VHKVGNKIEYNRIKCDSLMAKTLTEPTVTHRTAGTLTESSVTH